MIKVTLYNGKAVQSVQFANHDNPERAMDVARMTEANHITRAVAEDKETGVELARRTFRK